MPSSSLAALVSLALLALSPLATALPTPSGTEPAKRSFQTPTAVLRPPQYLEDAALRSAIAKMAAAAQTSAAVKARRSALDDVVDVDIQKRGTKAEGDTLLKRAACIDSTADETLISSLFHYGGAGTVVELCPGATIQLTGPVFFSAKEQVLTTQGNPTDDTRAKLVVTGADQACAIVSTCQGCDNVVVQNIQVAGQRDVLGYNNGVALLEMGGDNMGQTVKNCKLWEPRGWSALHGIEGNGNSCSGMVITGNEIGPSGHSPTNGKQFKRDDVYVPQQWADGISIACKGSKVQGNTIIDATDGGIVIFGALGSVVSGNTIIARERRPLGGINLVDWSPFSGSFEGTVVEGNTLFADTNMIKTGIALGGMVWGSDNRTAARTFGGTIRNNVFKSGSSGYFGYAIAAAGHQGVQVSGNDVSGASFGGGPSEACVPNPMVPTSQAFVYDHWTTTGSTLQNNFVHAPLVFLICQQPGPIVGTGATKAETGTMVVGQGDLDGGVAPSSSTPASSSATTTTTTTTTPAPGSTTTLRASSSTTTTTTTKVKTTTTLKRVFHSKVTRPKSSSSSSTGSAKPTSAAAARLQQTWGRVIAALQPQPAKRAAAAELEGAAEGPSPVAVAGWSKPTPVTNFVNPFDVLERHARLV